MKPGLRAWPRSPNRRSRSSRSPQESLAKLHGLGEVEAPDETAAIQKATAELKGAANRLMVIRR
jgi:hypothetical protein